MEEEKAKLDAFCEQSLKEVTDTTWTDYFQVRKKHIQTYLSIRLESARPVRKSLVKTHSCICTDFFFLFPALLTKAYRSKSFSLWFISLDRLSDRKGSVTVSCWKDRLHYRNISWPITAKVQPYWRNTWTAGRKLPKRVKNCQPVSSSYSVNRTGLVVFVCFVFPINFSLHLVGDITSVAIWSAGAIEQTWKTNELGNHNQADGRAAHCISYLTLWCRGPNNQDQLVHIYSIVLHKIQTSLI